MALLFHRSNILAQPIEDNLYDFGVKKMACDMCAKTGSSLQSLKAEYETDVIKQLCPECASLVNGQIWKIRKMNDGIMITTMRRFMSNRKNQATK